MNQILTVRPSRGVAPSRASSTPTLRKPASRKPARTRDRSSQPRIALVTSSWHADIVQHAATSIADEFERRGLAASQLERFRVPGAFEIPLFAQRLAAAGRFQAIIGCGLVINGGIYRHEFVAGAVIDGLMRVQLDTGVPVFSAVLTPQNFHDHDEHRRFFAEHFVAKGAEVARACLETLESLATVSA